MKYLIFLVASPTASFAPLHCVDAYVLTVMPVLNTFSRIYSIKYVNNLATHI